MSWKQLAVAASLFTAAAYVYDVIIRPARAAKKARKMSDELGKPMLNVGAGTAGSSLRAKLLGSQLVGDVNLDISASGATPHGRNRVSFGDIQDLPFEDKQFGVAYSSHVLEHVDRPGQALQELDRVADKVVAVVPKWWAPHAWLYNDHQWYVNQKGDFVPLWNRTGQKTLKASKIRQALRRARAQQKRRRRSEANKKAPEGLHLKGPGERMNSSRRQESPQDPPHGPA